MIGRGLEAPMQLPGGHLVYFERRGRVLCGRACIYTRFGPVQLTACVDLATVRRAAAAALKTKLGRYAVDLQELIASGDDAAVAGVFDDIGNWFKGAVKTIGKNKVFQDIAGGFKSILDNPITGPLISAIPFVGPALQATGQAAGFLANAYRGDPKAKKQLQQIRKRAKAGDPKAKKAFAQLQQVQKQGIAVAQGAPVPSRARVEPESPTRAELIAALEGLVAEYGAREEDEAAGEHVPHPNRVDPRRYDAMRSAYVASGYSIGQSGLPYTLEAGADGAYRLPRSAYGIRSVYGLRIQ
jgi:hypothetical protein